MLHSFAILLFGHFAQVNIAIEQGIAFCAVGILKICESRPDEETNQYVLCVARIVFADLVQCDFGVGLIFNCDLPTGESDVACLLDRNWLR